MRILILLLLSLPAWGQCQTTFTTHNSARISFCVTANGNILNLEGPPGWHQIDQNEGYAVCALDGSYGYWDLAGAGDSGNWGDPVLNQPKGANTFPFTITRSTADGKFTLVQTFKLVSGGKAVGVTMKLSGPQVILRRFAEVMPQANQTGDHTSTAAFVWSSSRDGLMVSPTANVNVVSGIAQGGVQNPCLLDGADGNLAIVESWVPNPASAYFEYAPMR